MVRRVKTLFAQGQTLGRKVLLRVTVALPFSSERGVVSAEVKGRRGEANKLFTDPLYSLYYSDTTVPTDN
jgi:hypothetical protein